MLIDVVPDFRVPEEVKRSSDGGFDYYIKPICKDGDVEYYELGYTLNDKADASTKKSLDDSPGKEYSLGFFAKHTPGVYICELNFNHHFSYDKYKAECSTTKTYASLWAKNPDAPERLKNADIPKYEEYYNCNHYGVADSVEQILEHPDTQIFFKDPNRKFMLFVTPIHKDTEPQFDGWRWCKWGRYIGIQEPKSDYLYNEPDITKVCVFHFYDIEEKCKEDSTPLD